MGSLTEKVQIRLIKEDVALLAKVAKARRCGQSPIVREALMEWFARRGFLDQDERGTLGFAAQTVLGRPASEPRPRSPNRPYNTRWSP